MNHAEFRLQEGQAYDLEDLQIAQKWVSGQGDVRLQVTTDHRDIVEAIEITARWCFSPRWCIWTDKSRFHVDDWFTAEFDVRFSTLTAALSFIAAKLDHLS
jgi:hypothetical protein